MFERKKSVWLFLLPGALGLPCVEGTLLRALGRPLRALGRFGGLLFWRFAYRLFSPGRGLGAHRGGRRLLHCLVLRAGASGLHGGFCRVEAILQLAAVALLLLGLALPDDGVVARAQRGHQRP